MSSKPASDQLMTCPKFTTEDSILIQLVDLSKLWIGPHTTLFGCFSGTPGAGEQKFLLNKVCHHEGAQGDRDGMTPKPCP